MITIIAKFKVKEASVEKFKKLAIDVTRQTKKEKGNLSYKIFQNREDKTSFTFIEEWLHEQAIAEHNTMPHFTEFVEAIKPHIEGGIDIEKLEKIPSVFF